MAVRRWGRFSVIVGHPVGGAGPRVNLSGPPGVITVLIEVGPRGATGPVDFP
jgi:hypothetical protein